jgi:hypothetical protein
MTLIFIIPYFLGFDLLGLIFCSNFRGVASIVIVNYEFMKSTLKPGKNANYSLF